MFRQRRADVIPILGLVAGGVIIVAATVSLVTHTPATSSELPPTPESSVVETTQDAARLGVDLPVHIVDLATCKPTEQSPPVLRAVRCVTTDGKALTSIRYPDNTAQSLAASYPNTWPASQAAQGRYTVLIDAPASTWTLRWTQTNSATVIEVPGFRDQGAAEQWFQQHDPQLEPR